MGCFFRVQVVAVVADCVKAIVRVIQIDLRASDGPVALAKELTVGGLLLNGLQVHVDTWVLHVVLSLRVELRSVSVF